MIHLLKKYEKVLHEFEKIKNGSCEVHFNNGLPVRIKVIDVKPIGKEEDNTCLV